MLRLYERSLRRPVPAVEPLMAVRTAMYEHGRGAAVLPAASFAERLARGDLLFAAFHGETLAGYLFASTAGCLIDEIDDVLRVAPDEVYLYDACTRPGFRGQRIYPHLITTAQRYFQAESYGHALIFAAAANTSSRKGIEQTGFRQYGRVCFWNVLGWKRWRMEIGERHVRSRLHLEN